MRLSVARVSIATLFVLLPLVAGAQNDELRATIRAVLLADPRTSSLSEADLEALITLLSTEAASQGISSEDIMWRPAAETAASPEVVSCTMPEFLCRLSESFGFQGSDLVIPIGLGVSAALLLFVIGSILLHRHGHHPVAGSLGSPSPGALPPPPVL